MKKRFEFVADKNTKYYLAVSHDMMENGCIFFVSNKFIQPIHGLYIIYKSLLVDPILHGPSICSTYNHNGLIEYSLIDAIKYCLNGKYYICG